MTPQTAAPLPDLDALPTDATIDAEAVAAILSCSVRTVHRLAASGELPPPLRCGQLVRWRVGNFRAWLRRQSEGVSA
jgi:predicted DNA-binding transcriptional regulator AlpA